VTGPRDPRIRPAEAGDASAIVALWTEAYVTEGEGGRSEPYADADFFDFAARGEVFVAERGGEVVGVVALLPPGAAGGAVARAGEAELARLAVAPAARRAGIGRALLARCEQRAREAGWPAIALWSRRYQGPARRLYEARGYRRTPERDSVDGTGHERVTFRLVLAQPLTARLEGSIVILEPLAEEHTEGLWEAAQAPEIWEWLFNIGQSREWFDRWLAISLEAAAKGEEGPFATCGAADGRPIGSTRYLNVRRADRVVEIGWTWLEPSAWGSGANLEAKLLMLRHAFEALDCVRVEFKTDARNERSRAALAAIPAQFEGVMRNHMIVPEIGLRDSAYFSVIDSEWPQVEASLERRLARRREAS
jgi:RimJ/RimL family protein N-acetyltransferase/ribosomal protein S18 acetylase RimI-like enzyme